MSNVDSSGNSNQNPETARRLCRTPVSDCPSEGPYTGVTSMADVDFGENGKFRILIYAAYNAFGLIGPENNGVMVARANEDKFDIIFDQGMIESSGYYGASLNQLRLFDKLKAADWTTFKALVNSQNMLRMTI